MPVSSSIVMHIVSERTGQALDEYAEPPIALDASRQIPLPGAPSEIPGVQPHDSTTVWAISDPGWRATFSYQILTPRSTKHRFCFRPFLNGHAQSNWDSNADGRTTSTDFGLYRDPLSGVILRRTWEFEGPSLEQENGNRWSEMSLGRTCLEIHVHRLWKAESISVTRAPLEPHPTEKFNWEGERSSLKYVPCSPSHLCMMFFYHPHIPTPRRNEHYLLKLI